MNKTRCKNAAILAALVWLGCTGMAVAQTGIKRSVVERADVSVPNREAVVARVELDAGALAERHTHHGDEIGYVLAGEGELLIDGARPRKLRPGDAFVVPSGVVHSARNTGAVAMRLVSVYVVEKGEALGTPAK